MLPAAFPGQRTAAASSCPRSRSKRRGVASVRRHDWPEAVPRRVRAWLVQPRLAVDARVEAPFDRAAAVQALEPRAEDWLHTAERAADALVLASDQILRAHRTKLPPNMRSLGDQYVRKEFADMRDVTKPEVLARFRGEWVAVWNGNVNATEGAGGQRNYMAISSDRVNWSAPVEAFSSAAAAIQ